MPPVAQVAKREVSRRRILESARKIFFRDGFAAANLDEVATEAGVAKGTIYRYFESKAELYVAVLAQNAEVFVKRMESTIDAGLGAEEQIRQIGLFYFNHYSENREYFRIFWALENQRLIGELPESLVRSVTDVWHRCLQILAAQIERGVAEGAFRTRDPWSVANIFWIVVNGLIQTEEYPARRELRGRDLEQVFENTMDLLIGGLLRSEG
jgi:AcrR family transcriptional regulator